MSDFIHLHTHSHYSLLNALPQISDLVKTAKADGQSALALTDSGNLYGAIEFYKTCRKAEIKPIIGLDGYLALRTRFDKQAGLDKERHRLVLLAKDLTGYRNLIKLVTASFLEGFYYTPRLDLELLERHHDGLIAIIPSFSGDLAAFLRQGRTTEATERLDWYRSVFSPDDLFLELTYHPEIADHQARMDQWVKFAEQHNIPLVAAHDVYYLKPEDRRSREIMRAIQTNRVVSDESELDSTENFSFLTQKQARLYFKDQPIALANTQKIADRCDLELDLGSWVFPHLETTNNKSHDQELRDKAYQGIAWRGLSQTKTVTDRLEYELKVIKDKRFSAYFLIVADFLDYARRHGILTTIRGSVAGSLTTYLLGVTHIDPLEYKLPFERFLNPERPKAPDIDMDFADNRRDEMIRYAREKYGEDKVAQIGTFGTMMARGSIRDVARALGYSYNIGDRIAKQVPMGAQGFPVTIGGALESVPELKNMYEREPEAREIIDAAQKIEGSARHISVHAAGVVISPEPLTDYVPLQYDSKGEQKIITQYDMHSVEEAGLIKFDFLGLKNLSILSDALERIKQKYDQQLNIEKIPLDDQKTFNILSQGETVGVFQLNGTAMTRYLMELKPNTIHDINAMVALYRPGPMESIPSYIERKHNPHLIKHLDPRLEKITDQSYGVITYQDDVLLIAVQLAGYSWLEADTLRKAMGKKIPEEMAAQKEKLINGLIENGMNQATADKLWKLIEPFAAYGFNKAHAASYGRVAYQTAYLKANYPAVYMSAVLTADSGDVEKIAEIIDECKRMKIPVLPPDINKSRGEFTVVKNPDTKEEEIRFGLYTIKNFGEGIADTIIAERDKAGEFEDLTDFIQRISDRNLNRKSLEALIKSGALDQFGERGIMLANVETILQFKRELTQAPINQTSLFAGLDDEAVQTKIKLQSTESASQDEILLWEKELLGLYLSGHPLDKHRGKLDRHDNSIQKVKSVVGEGVTTVVAGIIQTIRPLITKKGDRMAFVTLSDFTDSLDVVVFPEKYQAHQDLLAPDTCVAIKGKISYRNNQCSLIAEQIRGL